MQTHEILRNRWKEFFQDFTSDHDGKLVNIIIKGWQPDAAGVDTEVQMLPLRDVSADLKDNENTIVIAVGVNPDELLRHEIQTVSHVRLLQTDDGLDAGVQIESANGQMATIELKLK